jgi:hypothetical protein
MKIRPATAVKMRIFGMICRPGNEIMISPDFFSDFRDQFPSTFDVERPTLNEKKDANAERSTSSVYRGYCFPTFEVRS